MKSSTPISISSYIWGKVLLNSTTQNTAPGKIAILVVFF